LDRNIGKYQINKKLSQTSVNVSHQYNVLFASFKKTAGRIFPVGKLSGDAHAGTEGGFNSTNLHLTDFPSNMHIRERGTHYWPQQ